MTMATTVTTITGTASAADAALSAAVGEISGLGNEAVTLSDASLGATALNTLNGKTTGVVNAGSVTTLTGASADVNTAYAAGVAGDTGQGGGRGGCRLALTLLLYRGQPALRRA